MSKWYDDDVLTWVKNQSVIKSLIELNLNVDVKVETVEYGFDFTRDLGQYVNEEPVRGFFVDRRGTKYCVHGGNFRYDAEDTRHLPGTLYHSNLVDQHGRLIPICRPGTRADRGEYQFIVPRNHEIDPSIETSKIWLKHRLNGRFKKLGINPFVFGYDDKAKALAVSALYASENIIRLQQYGERWDYVSVVINVIDVSGTMVTEHTAYSPCFESDSDWEYVQSDILTPLMHDVSTHFQDMLEKA